MSHPDPRHDPTEPTLPDDADWRQQEELGEYEYWLDKLEQDKLKDLDKHLQRNFDELFKTGDDHENR